MYDSNELRQYQGKKLRFRFASGTEIVGVLFEIRPAVGPPEMAILQDADVISSGGTVLGHHTLLSLVPSDLKSVEEGAVPAISFRTPRNP